jgi:hypothetical protein
MEHSNSRTNSNAVMLLTSLASGQSLSTVLPMLVSVVAMDMFLEIHHIALFVGLIMVVKYYSKRRDNFQNPLKKAWSLAKSLFTPKMFEVKMFASSELRSSKLLIVSKYLDSLIPLSKEAFSCFILPELFFINIYTFFNSLNQYEVQPGLFVSFNYEKVSQPGKKGETRNIHEIELVLRSKDLKVIQNFVKDAETFDLHTYKELTIFESRVDYNDGKPCDSFLSCRAPMKSLKTFDNLFFEDKPRILHYLDRFINSKSEYARLGMPHSLGMLFHGSPGTGKTSTIKAIANHTKRHICIINEIPNLSCLRELFGNCEQVARRIYVFEEIDAGLLGEAFKPRSSISENDEKKVCQQYSDATAIAMAALASSMSKKEDFKNTVVKKPSTITLAEFLEFLDGLVEMPSRMIIFTTNHPEKLDPALLRPGRVDLIVEFKKMRRCDVVDMYHLWFQHDMPDTVQRHLKDFQFTQAEIGELFSSQDLALIHSKLSQTH